MANGSGALDRQLSAVIDDERAHQAEYAGRREEHQSKEVASRHLDDHADDDRHEDAADISGEIHDAAENAGAPAIGQRGRNAPVEPAPAQEEQRAREERDRSHGTADESKKESGQGRQHTRYAQNGTHDEVGRTAARLPIVRQKAAGDLANKAGAKNDERGAANG